MIPDIFVDRSRQRVMSELTTHKKHNVLVTGVAGWLGQFVWKSFIGISEEFDIYGMYHNKLPTWIQPSHRIEVDLDNSIAVEEAIARINPSIVIHLAAISALTACERDSNTAARVNSPMALIDAVSRLCPNSLFIYTSTDLVFDGEKGHPYSPEDEASSHTVYGTTKLQFEQLVTSKLKYGIVLRLSNMIGPKYAYEYVGTKFMQFLYESFQTKAYTGLRYDEIRSFVYVDDVVLLIHKIIRYYINNIIVTDENLENVLKINNNIKIFHVGGPDGLSRLDLAQIMIESSNIASVKVNLIVDDDKRDESSLISDESHDSNQLIWRVYRTSNANGIQLTGIKNPRDVTMDSTRTEKLFHISFKSMREAVPICIESLNAAFSE